MPSPRRIASARRRRRSASGCSRASSLCGETIRKRDRPLRRALADLLRAAARRRPSRSRRRARSPRRPARAPGRRRRARPAGRERRPAIRSTTFRRSQPERCCGCVETTISSGGGSSVASASRMAATGSVSTTCPWPGSRLSAATRASSPAGAGRGAAGVLVDDVALARLVDRRDHGHAHRPVLAPPLERLDQAPAGDRLVRDHEHMVPRAALTRAPPRLRVHAVAVEDAVPRARHAVLVRAADDLRDLVEVEDRRRRGHLPLERQRAPRVGGRASPRSASS